MDYAQVQAIARQTMREIQDAVCPGMRLAEVRSVCEERMLSLGADSFWYWGIGAFVFSGDETAVSVSGREYRTSDRVIQADDILTIDLSPQCGDVWGDFARTIVLEDGCAVRDPEQIRKKEWREGLRMERLLHRELHSFAREQTTFEELSAHMNTLIGECGYVNLDFSGNLGHSIERRREDRVYIEPGNGRRLGEVSYFTFEPHIAVKGSVYGYKLENIYYFENGSLREL